MLALTGLAAVSVPAPDHEGKSSCSSTAGTSSSAGDKDVVDTAVAAGSFNTLAAALRAADLVSALKGKGPFTVFAPTDEAFAKLQKGTLEHLLDPKNKAELQAILTYHVVPASLSAADVVQLKSAATLNGQRIDIKVSEAGVGVDGAKVVKTDIRCLNGVIHVIDSVLLPSTKDLVTTAVDAGQFRTLAQALQAAGLVEALREKGPYTVFAPSDEAFAKLPAGTLESLLLPENREKLVAILKLHVIPGRVDSQTASKGANVASLQGGKLEIRLADGRLMVNGAHVVAGDVDASNGVIHVIDSVLLPE
jgi:uncharacterized surface protein with fasciclin (FAS1) repeats